MRRSSKPEDSKRATTATKKPRIASAKGPPRCSTHIYAKQALKHTRRKLSNADLEDSTTLCTPAMLKYSATTTLYGGSPIDSRNDEKQSIQEIEVLASELRATKQALRDLKQRNAQNLARVAELQDEQEQASKFQQKESRVQAQGEEKRRDLEEQVKALRYENCQLVRQLERERTQAEQTEAGEHKARADMAEAIRQASAQTGDRVDAVRTYLLAMEQVLEDEDKAEVFLKNVRKANQEIGELAGQMLKAAKRQAKDPSAVKSIKIGSSFAQLRDELLDFVEASKQELERRKSQRGAKEQALENELDDLKLKLVKQTKQKVALQGQIQTYQEEVGKMRDLIDRMRGKLQEERDASTALRKQLAGVSQNYGDFKFKGAEGELVSQLRVELANERREAQKWRENAHNLEEENKKIETEKVFAQRQVENLKRRMDELLGGGGNSSITASVESSVQKQIQSIQEKNELHDYLSRSDQSQDNIFELSLSRNPRMVSTEEITAKFISVKDEEPVATTTNKSPPSDLRAELEELTAAKQCLSTTAGGSTPVSSALTPQSSVGRFVEERKGHTSLLAEPWRKVWVDGKRQVPKVWTDDSGQGGQLRVPPLGRSAFTPAAKLRNELASLDGEIGAISSKLEAAMVVDP